MTNEKAIEILEECWRYAKTYKYTDAEIREAFDMAIKALEQQPCEDWLQTFNTDSATECFTAVQRLKESLNDRLDASYKG